MATTSAPKRGGEDRDEVAVLFRLSRAERTRLQDQAIQEGFSTLQGYLDHCLLGKEGSQRRGRPPRRRYYNDQEELFRTA